MPKHRYFGFIFYDLLNLIFNKCQRIVWYNTELNIISNFITFVEELLLLWANGSGFDRLALNNSASKSKWVNTSKVTV